MILLIYEFLSRKLGLALPSVFTYSSTRMILAAITTLFLTIFLGKSFICRLYALKTGSPIRTEDCPLLAPLHEKKKDTPTMGGLLILFSLLISLVLWMDWKSAFTLILLTSTLWLGVIGGVDDYLKLKKKNSKGISGKKKFLWQAALACLLGLYLYIPGVAEMMHFGQWFSPPTAKLGATALSTQEYLSLYFAPFMKEPFALGGIVLSFLFLIFMVNGSSNAVNLTDGLDGLAAGCVVMASAVFALFAFLSNHHEIANYLNILYIEGSGEIAIYLFALAGACLGFLWYNGYPAQVFMGDIGSLSLGGILGVAAVLLRRELLLGIVGGIFVVEALSVILQVGSYKLRGKKRIFLCAPIHHHFECKGWPETKVVLRFWIVSLLLAMIGIASLKFQ